MTDYDQDSTERKWQRIWEQERCFEVEQQPSRPKFYCLEMLPYPSGRIHMGHVRNYAIGDAVARFRMMRGYAVLHPMGWDSFGLPAENAAIQRKRHPRDWTEANIADMRGQLKRMGFAYAWSREIASHRPEYYRWNQWLFIRMFERGLAYRSRRPVNWCPSCRTVLANEQVEEDKCWRCGSGVVQKELPQWFFRTSRYADELLEDLDRLDGWPARVLAMQRNWIGRSDGAMIDFPLEDASERLKVFTTRLDTIHGATFLALSPDHPQMKTILKGSPRAETVEKYLEESRRLLVSEKLNPDRGKNGVFTGKFAVNPFTQEKIPIWVADFVLMGYGTGAIMGVPAHDERDHEFATRYRLPIRRVIVASDGGPPPLPFTDPDGRTIDSGEFSGLACDEARRMMLAHAERSGFGEASVQYRLRDWGISRQRYWGTPIPMLYCDGCGIVPVDLSDLPVVLPDDVDLTGRGGSPLQNSAEFTQASCPRCGGLARRETDTMDTFVDSAWYFYRYLDPDNATAPFRAELARAWFPIDLYIGGITHAILHLMYARFFSMVMRDLGLGVPGEPVKRLLCQGMVLKDGSAMSKSRGNVVAPETMVDRYGADVTRLFVLFAAPPERDLEWNEEGVEGLQRFLRRVWRLVEAPAAELAGVSARPDSGGPEALALRRMAHGTLARVTHDIEQRIHLNTAIAATMELTNALYAFRPPEGARGAESLGAGDAAVLKEAIEILLICLAPFAPHLAEEGWSRLGHGGLIARHAWPEPDSALLVRDEVTIVVQINGRIRGRVTVARGAGEEDVLQVVRADARLAPQAFPDGEARPSRTIFVPDRLINVVTSC